MANILSLADIEFFPIRSGDQRTTFEICRFLSLKGHKIIIVVIGVEDVLYAQKCKSLGFIDSIHFIKSPKKRFPFGIFFRILNKIFLKLFKTTVKQPYILARLEIEKLNYIIKNEKIDTLIIHRAHLGRYVKHFFNARKIYKVLQAHDLQFLRDSRFFEFKGYINQKRLEGAVRSEIEIFDMFDEVIDLADYEVQELKNRGINTESIKCNGSPVEYEEYSKYRKDAKYDIVFVGSNIFQNQVSIEWFLKNVWDQIYGEKISLAVAGSISTWKEFEKFTGEICLLGYYENIKQIYHDCKIVIAPIVVGSGTKVKVVEALMNSKPVITNCLGIEGINLERGKDYLHCEAPSEWITTISNYINDDEKLENIGKNAWLWASKNARVEHIYGDLERNIYNN